MSKIIKKLNNSLISKQLVVYNSLI